MANNSMPKLSKFQISHLFHAVVQIMFDLIEVEKSGKFEVLLFSQSIYGLNFWTIIYFETSVAFIYIFHKSPWGF